MKCSTSWSWMKSWGTGVWYSETKNRHRQKDQVCPAVFLSQPCVDGWHCCPPGIPAWMKIYNSMICKWNKRCIHVDQFYLCFDNTSFNNETVHLCNVYCNVYMTVAHTCSRREYLCDYMEAHVLGTMSCSWGTALYEKARGVGWSLSLCMAFNARIYEPIFGPLLAGFYLDVGVHTKQSHASQSDPREMCKNCPCMSYCTF